MAADSALQTGGMAAAACPHVVFRDVLGKDMVADLLDYVAARQTDFKPAVVRKRTSGERRVDYGLRNSLMFGDLGAFKAPIEAFVRGVVISAVEHLHLPEPALEPKEFAIVGYRDGSHFSAHIDTDERVNRVRVLSCVYYFAATPRRFSGGELRIHGLPTLSAGRVATPQFVDVMPETNTMVVFPSWLRHEVRPVGVPSGEWRDSRFTINCWMHRAA